MHSAMASAAWMREQGARVRVDNRHTTSHRPMWSGCARQIVAQMQGAVIAALRRKRRLFRQAMILQWTLL